MTESERYLVLDTMCRLALAGRADDDVFAFGDRMAAWLNRNESAIDLGFVEVCEAAKRRAGID